MPRAMPRQRLVVAQRDQRLEQRGDLAVDPVAEAAAHLLGDLGIGVLVDEGLHLRARARRRRRPACRRRARPTSARPARSRRSRCRARCRTCRRAGDSAGASAATPAARRVRACSASAVGSSRKRKPSSRPTNWSSIETSPFSVTVATRLSLCFSRRISTTGAPVDEPLGQPRVQRVRQPVFYRTGLVAPMVRVVDPGRRAAPT